MTTPTREIHLARRPDGFPTAATFSLVHTLLREPVEGEVVVRNTALSVDPYMRPRMDDVPSYAPPYALGEALTGGAVGEVVASADPDVPVGTSVVHMAGWREHALLPATAVTAVPIEPFPPSYRLGVLGMPGFTAYLGLLRIAALAPGDVVLVSGAAGAVGGLVGQIARQRGASRVIGSAGSHEKARYVCEELGFDACLDYRRGSLVDQMRRASPAGVDVYFDNVGGAHLAAALEVMREHGRIALCGAVASYNNAAEPVLPANMFAAVTKQLTLRGFLTRDHADLRAPFEDDMATWLSSGAVRYRESVTRGLEQMPEAFIGMLRGSNTGKAVIELQ